jgi:hypothetical protein
MYQYSSFRMYQYSSFHTYVDCHVTKSKVQAGAVTGAVSSRVSNNVGVVSLLDQMGSKGLPFWYQSSVPKLKDPPKI